MLKSKKKSKVGWTFDMLMRSLAGAKRIWLLTGTKEPQVWRGKYSEERVQQSFATSPDIMDKFKETQVPW